MTETAGNRADPRGGRAENFAGDTAGVHQLGREDKERDGQQRVGAGVADKAVENRVDRELSGQDAGNQRGNGQRKRDGHAEDHQQQEAADEHQNQNAKAHAATSLSDGQSPGLRLRMMSIRWTTENAAPMGKDR